MRLGKRGEGRLVSGVDDSLAGGAGSGAATGAATLAATGTALAAALGAVTTGLALGALRASELAVDLNEDLLLLGLLGLGLGLLGLAGEEGVLLLAREDLALDVVGGNLADLLLAEVAAKSLLGTLGEVLVESLGVVLLLGLDLLGDLGGGGLSGALLLALGLGYIVSLQNHASAHVLLTGQVSLALLVGVLLGGLLLTRLSGAGSAGSALGATGTGGTGGARSAGRAVLARTLGVPVRAANLLGRSCRE